MEGDIHGVRIEPRVLNFFHTVPGKIYTLTINVKNVSEKGCSIRYYGPENTKNFHLKVKNPEEPVAPGLCVPASVEYNATEEAEMTDRLVLTIDDEILEVPIFTYLSCPHLELPRDVDFGTVIADSKVITKEISLINSGAKAGEFKITYNGQKHISFTPSVGSIPPNSMQIIKVEFVTKIPGKLEETLIVEMEGVEPKELTIHGNVCNPLIEILSLKDEQPIKCISFGNTYYGTDCTECALLFNNSPATLSFVAMIDESAPGQEMGIDMTSTTTGALAEEDGYNSRHGSINALTSLITTIPNQGVLQPYQKIPIFFRFSPRWNKAQVGWKSKVIPPPRKDFALFVRFEMSGSSKGFSEITVVKKKGHFSTTGKFAEVALTATALPVLLDISPSDSLDFGECPVGESVDTLCTIRNESFLLPAIFQFRRIAHFSARPLNGKISPGQTQDVVFSFVPKQVGTFKPLMLLDVLGQTADTYNPSLTNLEVISTLSTRVSGHSNPVTVVPKPRFNPGLTPYITNEVGMYVETTFADVDSKVPRNALAGSTRVHLHRIYRPKSLDIEDKKVKVAFPNDRPHSVRPSERNQIFRTPFTYMDRYNYVDPDYALTDDEILTRRSHRSYYVEHLHLIQDLKKERRRKREYKLTANQTDIGLQPAAGLLPRPLKLKEIKSASPSLPPPNEEWRLLSTQELAVAEKEAMSKPVQEGLNAVPTTDKEKADCKKWLSPQNLHQIVVGPPTIEFGKVCMRSVSQKELNIINNLLDYILVEATIDSRELRQSSPLSQVVPPRSRAVIPIIFESNTKGNFQRSVTYTINGFHKNHVTVMAEVVCVGLELSTENLVLMPTLGLPADAGFRGVITLHNRLNYPAEFTWSPDIGERGTAFSIRPATGTVNTNSSLDCEVVWHPSYLAPQDGSFMLIVHGGEPLKLQCLAEMGPTSVSFVEQRIAFGSVPVNLTTTKSAFLQNTGVNHGYFQVLDPNPFPGLTVTPVHGVIPVGGVTELFVSLTPDTVLKFDAHIQIAIKGSRTVDLRMGGIVESPSVDMSVVKFFQLWWCYCGCKSSISFKMFNKGNTRCKLEFDLTRYKDFSLSFPGFQTTEDRNYQIMNPGMSTITILPLQTIKGELSFLPLQVAAYDFLMPVIINHMSAPTPSATPSPPTTMPSVKKTFHQPISSQPAVGDSP
ncbi:hypothetical protein C0Q70_10779 [Pomacea canaliculata]|uniref:HYDIN/VesB/CFA65-like Ig-like domain-containing protein n=1 Tax=Pomacea canaliculata TaxID=400727 RepID=A0A2T7P465_POMCA|nr:hypothetical protein C0Q70_10779 [Pomacea canaliculata]